MAAVTVSGLASTLWSRIARRLEARWLRWTIAGYERDLDVLHAEASNNRMARRLIQHEQIQRRNRLAELSQ
jgi:hypothetical protein